MRSGVVFAAVLWAVGVFATRVEAESRQDQLARADSLFAEQARDSAVSLARQILHEVEAQSGPQDTSVARVLDHLGDFQQRLAQYTQADTVFTRALRIRENVFGADHLEVASTCYRLGVIQFLLGDYASSEGYFSRALRIRETQLPSDHPDLATSLNGLGNAYRYQGDYLQAERLFLRAVAIWEGQKGQEHPDIAKGLTSLATLRWEMGKYADAEVMYRRALETQKALTGPHHPFVAKALTGLANVAWQLGKYAQAEPLYEEVLSIERELLGPEHPDIARDLINLGYVCVAQSRFDQARAYYDQALTVLEKALGPEDLSRATCLDGLAYALWVQERFAQAESLFTESLEIREHALGVEDPDVATSLNSLAAICTDAGRLDNAERYANRALAITEKAFGPTHQAAANSLVILAQICETGGRFADATPLLDRALHIREGTLGRRHPDVAECLEQLSICRRATGDPNAGLPLAEEAVNIRHNNLRTLARVLPERDALTHSRYLRASLSGLLSCLRDCGDSADFPVERVADLILAAKGEVSDAVIARQHALVAGADSATRMLADEYLIVVRQLSQLVVDGPQETGVAEYRHLVDSLSARAAAGESRLARSGGTVHSADQVTAARIVERLPQRSALIEYVRYDYSSPRRDTAVSRYLAVVIRRSQAPVIVDLGGSSAIDAAVNQYRKHFLAVAQTDRPPTIIEQTRYGEIADSLYKLVWLPLARHVENSDLVLVAPDGGLNLVSFAGLRDRDGAYLVENFALEYLSAGRDLLRQEATAAASQGLLALGDPDYDAPAESRTASTTRIPELPTSPSSWAVRNVRSGCRELAGMTVGRLPGSRREIEEIAAEWERSEGLPAIVYLDAQASEERFKAEARGFRFIHLATHGFFFERACASSLSSAAAGRPEFTAENPLLFSGLLLAGANRHAREREGTNGEDGVLTALEVSAMDLEGTELVVLSACETGIGEVRAGEGVYGLRRAFQLAGARAVISTLWPIPDLVTAQAMKRLYELRTESLPLALRRLQMERIGALRTSGEPDHPFAWGAFIALGDWPYVRGRGAKPD